MAENVLGGNLCVYWLSENCRVADTLCHESTNLDEIVLIIVFTDNRFFNLTGSRRKK